MFKNIDEVWHVGSLDPASRTRRPSLEGPCLSVSVDPQDWGHIARIAGPVWTLNRPGATWLDACNLTDSERAGIMSWAEAEGLAEPCELWRAWIYDSEADSWSYMTCADYESALEEIDGDTLCDGVPSETGGLVDSVSGWSLTDRGMETLERWADRLDGEAGAIILYAMLKLAPEMPELAGIWWDELHDPLSLSCPRGGILPERLGEFEIADELGSLPPFRQDEGIEP